MFQEKDLSVASQPPELSVDLIRHQMVLFKTCSYTDEAISGYFLQNLQRGQQLPEVLLAHAVLEQLDPNIIKKMLSTVAKLADGFVFSFLMARDQEGNTVGHLLFNHKRFHAAELIQTEVSQAFFACVHKLTPACQNDLCLSKNNQNQTMGDLVMQLDNQALVHAYFHYADHVKPASQVVVSHQSAFRAFKKASCSLPPIVKSAKVEKEKKLVIHIPDATEGIAMHAPSVQHKKRQEKPVFLDEETSDEWVPGPPKETPKAPPTLVQSNRYRKQYLFGNPLVMQAVDLAPDHQSTEDINLGI